ncbi:hypothetical protein BgAZ_501210 [Babesia gibsoni]|uniref:Uncharacterized protein n=1 Tax=Babesia gibsoni TaxID=33632 RepID=A0AAD8LJ58_BABGI|nr:hypothetical protein BgAZ_501210 [Babesia gibsoni]
MQLSAVMLRQQSLQNAFIGTLKASDPGDKVLHMNAFIQDIGWLLEYIGKRDLESSICDGINDSVLNMTQVAVAGLTKLSREDMERQSHRQQIHAVMELMKLMVELHIDTPAASSIIVLGIAHVWRLLFCQSDSTMDTTTERLRLHSAKLVDLLHLVTCAYSNLDCQQHYVQLCYIMLELFRLTDVKQHICSTLDTLATLPMNVDLFQIYPGLVSRIVVKLSKLRESEFASAMNVLSVWIKGALNERICSECKSQTAETIAAMASKTSEAICHIFNKYSKVYGQHMSGLCAACLTCSGMSSDAFQCLYQYLVMLLCDQARIQLVREILLKSPDNAKLGLWREVTSFIKSKDPDAIKVYLGYMELYSSVPGLEELDSYIATGLIYGSVNLPTIESDSSVKSFSALALFDDRMIDLCVNSEQEQLFTKAAALCVAKMPLTMQKQCISTLIDCLINKNEDTLAVARVLTILHGFLSAGDPQLGTVIPDLVDTIMVNVLPKHRQNAIVELSSIYLLSVVFSLYCPELPQQQICDILFWSLPLCVSGNEKTVNSARVLLAKMSTHQLKKSGAANDTGVRPLLRYYKNLLVSRCIRELRNTQGIVENVAKVIYALLCYCQLGVKDIFDVTLELDKCCQHQEMVGTMPDLSRVATKREEVNLHALYCYAHLARYIDEQFDQLWKPEELMDEKRLPIDSLATSTAIVTHKSGKDVELGEEVTYEQDFRDKRLAVATLISTRCRYYICGSSTEARNAALFAIHRCIGAFSRNIPVMRIRLYETWDSLFLCMEQNIGNLRTMASIFGILTIAANKSFDFVERWLIDILDKLSEMLIEECKSNNVTMADEANASIRFKFSIAMLHFILEVSSHVINRDLFSKLFLVVLLMCRSTAPSVEKLAASALANLYRKNPPLVRNVLVHAGYGDPASLALLRFALKRDLSKVIPKGARLCRLLPLAIDV